MWFRRLPFRQAVSLAIDRDALVRLVYRGRATALWGHLPPGNKLWVNRSLPGPRRSVDEARRLLRGAGFTWTADGTLVDEKAQPVEFTIATNTGNAERLQIATIIQDDLKQLGMRARVVTLELRALLDRVMTTYDYDAVVLALGGGDVGSQLGTESLAVGRQPASLEHGPDAARHGVGAGSRYADAPAAHRARSRGAQAPLRSRAGAGPREPADRVAGQSEHSGRREKGLGNFRPTILEHHALWNVEELFWRERRSGGPE